ncbi:MAG TPA: xanthine dehydrogenase small subunit [Burkholderiaceae bacterium]|nr:xanthine dehydrogenase small subunit [Burkholderiaceae bacterium]
MAGQKESREDPGGTIRFVLDRKVVALKDVDPTRTVLEYLREDCGRTGTKEGCAEGDCGACTVVLAELEGSGVRFRAVNSCIQFVPTLDGKELITVENLRGSRGGLHPVQQAIVDCHGSQCGFCTPGFAMSLFALYKSRSDPSRAEITEALAGNLCRCTGYRPLVEAAERMYRIGHEASDRHEHWMSCSFSTETSVEAAAGEREMIERLEAIRPRGTLELRHGDSRFVAPASLDELARVRAKHPEARILAGGTDVGLWVTKQHRRLRELIHVGRVAELRRIETTDTHLEIGAAACITDAMPAVARHFPHFAELLRRYASPPIRNAATLGGNVANGSPIGDSMPALIALGATIVLRRADGARELPLEAFYLGYQKNAFEPGEFLERIRIPLLPPASRFRTYKVSKRIDQDISAVCAAYRLDFDGATIADARIAHGGMAATPKRAAACERALVGRPWNDATLAAAAAALESDYAPISDMRASAAYRRLVARNLLTRFFVETTGAAAATRIHEVSCR